jgi:glycine/D-amino acid oxidase-like deaminating enzyme
MTQFLIVGQGLAAFTIAHQLHKRDIEFTLLGDNSLSNSSLIAAGIWNPISFKRMQQSWKADVLIPYLLNFYKSIEEKLACKLIYERELIRPFSEEQEKKFWQKKQKKELHLFLDENIYSEKGIALFNCKINKGFGKVLQAGNLNVRMFIEKSVDYFKDKIVHEKFEYKHLKISSDFIVYKNISALNIVFCEGYQLQFNTFFNYLPLKCVKGEMLNINSHELKLNNVILYKNGFILDEGSASFKVGSTYNWNELNEIPTENGQKELVEKLNELIEAKYNITNQVAGIRPTVIDRRPLIGAHPNYKNLFVFNGLGTKGVMLAPYLSENFVNFVLNKSELLPEIDVKRFVHLF